MITVPGFELLSMWSGVRLSGGLRSWRGAWCRTRRRWWRRRMRPTELGGTKPASVGRASWQVRRQSSVGHQPRTDHESAAAGSHVCAPAPWDCELFLVFGKPAEVSTPHSNWGGDLCMSSPSPVGGGGLCMSFRTIRHCVCRKGFVWFLIVFLGLPAGFPTLPALF